MSSCIPALQALLDPGHEFWFDDAPRPEQHHSVSQRLLWVLEKSARLPPFPSGVEALGHALQGPDAHILDLEELIGCDPALTSCFLRVANSSVYAGGGRCDSVAMALVRLGPTGVRSVCTGLERLATFSDNDQNASLIRDHGVGVSAVLRTLGQAWQLRSSEKLVLCGLMHDVGKLLLSQSGMIDYGNLPGALVDTADSLHTVERERLGFDHAVIGGHILRTWGFPDPIPLVVAWHHQPTRAYRVGGEVGLMVALLRLANVLEYQLHSDRLVNPYFLEDLADTPCARQTGFHAHDLETLWPRLLADHDRMLGHLGAYARGRRLS